MYIIQQKIYQSQIKDWQRSQAKPEGTSGLQLLRALIHLFSRTGYVHTSSKMESSPPAIHPTTDLSTSTVGDFREDKVKLPVWQLSGRFI